VERLTKFLRWCWRRLVFDQYDNVRVVFVVFGFLGIALLFLAGVWFFYFRPAHKQLVTYCQQACAVQHLDYYKVDDDKGNCFCSTGDRVEQIP
jgi:cbb3-type cytochrome oxidase subunit 3